MVIASYNYCSKVTKSLSFLTIMLFKGFTLITTAGFSTAGVKLTGHASLRARDMGEVIVPAL
jgi:hypothetical protein